MLMRRSPSFAADQRRAGRKVRSRALEPSRPGAVEPDHHLSGKERRMGLLDSILGNLTGQGGGFGGPGPQTRGGGTSPIVKALMLLLAAKAFQHYTSGRQGGPAPGGGAVDGGRGGGFGGGGGGPWGDLAGSLDPRGGQGIGPGQGAGPGGFGPSGSGGLGGLLQGGLGGLLGGLIGGGGLGTIVDQFRRSGYGDEVESWIGRGDNRRLAPHQLAEALGPDTIDELERETGLPRDEVLSELSEELPDAVDRFTPDGRLPTEEEVSSRWV
jgi:uncharacterized protein YidB (DUF937 family)